MSAPILFVCQLNAVRSPIAEGLARSMGIKADSCGIDPANEPDELMIAVMKERGIDMSSHEPSSIRDHVGKHFSRIVAFSDDTRDTAEALFGGDVNIDLWRVPNPATGSYDVRAVMDTYRSIRDVIRTRLTKLADQTS